MIPDVKQPESSERSARADCQATTFGTTASTSGGFEVIEHRDGIRINRPRTFSRGIRPQAL
jgi:hypothetical protein